MARTAGTTGTPRESAKDFDHPYVAVDVVLLTVRDGQLSVPVLHRQGEAPQGWALPGAFVQDDEEVDATAARVLDEKLGFSTGPDFIPLKPFSEIHRDSRRRVITLPHLALVDLNALEGNVEETTKPVEVAEVSLDASGLQVSVRGEPTELVFDHPAILEEAVVEVRRIVRLDDFPIYRQLLPGNFTLRHLQEVHEAVLGERVNRDSFRRRLTSSGRLFGTGKYETDVEHRPAELWRWRDEPTS